MTTWTINLKSLIKISSKPVAVELDIDNTRIVTHLSMIKRVENKSYGIECFTVSNELSILQEIV